MSEPKQLVAEIIIEGIKRFIEINPDAVGYIAQHLDLLTSPKTVPMAMLMDARDLGFRDGIYDPETTSTKLSEIAKHYDYEATE